MKLSKINYGGRAESLSPGAKLRSAKQWSNAIEALADTALKYVDKKEAEAFKELQTEAIVGDMRQDAMLSQEFIDPKDIPTGINYQANEQKLVNGVNTVVPRTRIPTYEVQSDLKNSYWAQMEERAKTSLSPGAYKKWRDWSTLYSESSKVKNGVKQYDAAQKAGRARTEQDIDELVRLGKYEDAAQRNADSQFHNETDKAARAIAIEEQAFTDPIYDALRDEDINRMRAARQALDQPNVLGAAKSTVLDTKLRTRINSILSKQESANTAYKKQLKDRASVQSKAYKNGYSADADETMALHDQLIANGMQKEAADLIRSADIAGKIQFISSLPLEQQEPTLLAWGADSKNDPEAWNRFVEIREGVEQQRENYRNDSIGEMNRRDPGSIAPLNVDDPSSMQQRRRDTEVVSEQNGYVSSYISDEEAEQINNRLEDGSIEERMELAINVSAGFGSEATKVWSRTKAASAAPEISYAAELVSRGKPELGKSVFRGIDILKENKDFLKDHNVDMRNDSDFRESVLSFPAGKERDAYSGAVIARYADLVNLKGIDRYDSSIMDQAIADVSMGEVTYAGARFVNPVPGVANENSFEEFMDKMTPEYILSLGKPANATAEEIANGLKDNNWFGGPEFNLYQVSRNAFLIQFAENPGVFVQEYLPNGQTRPFHFYYDPVREEEQKEPAEVRSDVNRRGRPVGRSPQQTMNFDMPTDNPVTLEGGF